MNHVVAGLNSYLGFFVHTQSYRMKKKAFSQVTWFWKTCYIQGHFQIIKIRQKYKLTTYARERNNNEIYCRDIP